MDIKNAMAPAKGKEFPNVPQVNVQLSGVNRVDALLAFIFKSLQSQISISRHKQLPFPKTRYSFLSVSVSHTQLAGAKYLLFLLLQNSSH